MSQRDQWILARSVFVVTDGDPSSRMFAGQFALSQARSEDIVILG